MVPDESVNANWIVVKSKTLIFIRKWFFLFAEIGYHLWMGKKKNRMPSPI